MSKGEIVLLCCSVASLIASCVIWSARKQAWMDEIFTWKEVSDPSLWHLFSAIQHGADGGQPLFYATAWLWAKTFGAGVLSLRLYSCLSVCGALLVTWACIRRVYGMWATAFGVLTIWGASGLLLDQNAEARFYGLFMFTVALAVALFLRLAADSKPSRLLLVLNLVAQGALVLTHVLGVIYSGLILLALLLFDVMERRVRVKVYLSYVAGWLALLIWIPAIRASMAAGKPHGWIPVPTLYNLYDSYFYWDYLPWLSLLQRHAPDFVFQICRRGAQLTILFPLAVVLFLALQKLLKAGRLFFSKQESALLVIAFVLLSTPMALFFLSLTVTPVFVPRYLLPTAIGMAAVLAAFAHYVALKIPVSLRAVGRLVAIMIGLFLLVSPVASALLRGAESTNSRFLDVQRLDELVPPDTAVVVDWQQDFSKLMRYSRKTESPYYFLLDWSAALAGPRAYVLDYHLMRSYRDAGYYGQNILDNKKFLCSHTDFLVLDTHILDPIEREPTWFDYSIRSDPRFIWKILESLDGQGVKRELIAVHQRAPFSRCDQP